jgi:hypothetical protein
MIGNGVKIFFLFLFLCGWSSYAQDIEFNAAAKPVVSVGEVFNLTFTINAQGMNFKGPSINDFSILSGPNTSTTSSIRSINGRTSMSIIYTYGYLIQATREGTFTIPPATVIVDRKSYQSNSLTVKVVKGSGTNPAQPQQQGNYQQGRGSQQSQGAVQSGSNDVYLKAFVDNANPLQGEGIIVTYKLFTKVYVDQITIKKLSSFPGFWSQNLIKENEKFNTYKQVIDGEQYVVADIRKIALFPLKSGKLTIDPLELECVAQVKRQGKPRTGDPFFDDFFNDPFFNNSVTPVEKSLKSNPLVINVRPLPSTDQPADFSGAVGNFTFKTDIDKTQVKTNEAINLKFTISGNGNIQLIDKVNVTFPPDFETYDPKITSDIKPSSTGISGSQTFEYLFIPRKPGKFDIKPITFSYFDLSKKKYVSLTSPQYTINVEKGSGEATNITYTGQNKEDIKYIGSDIRYIKNQITDFHRIGTFFFASVGFYLSLLLPFVLFILFIIYWKKHSARRNDTLLMKNRKATKIARKRLKKASEFLSGKNMNEFYIEISQALWGYISDKFSIPLAELSIESVHQALIQKNVSQEIIKDFSDTLNNIEYARFAPGEKSILMEKTYKEAMEIIMKTERELK